jgi:hypothetical protein
MRTTATHKAIMQYHHGAQQVWRMVNVPSVEARINAIFPGT